MDKTDLSLNIYGQRMDSKYIISKIDNNRYCITNGQFSRHLKLNSLTYQEYYENYITGIKEVCSCGDPKTLYKHTHTYANSCGKPKCVGNTIKIVKSQWTEEKRLLDSENKKAAQSKRTPADMHRILQKSRDTQISKHGGVLAAQTDEMKFKSKKTKLEKYGNEYYSGWDKSQRTNKNKTQDEKNCINQKRRETNLARFGVENTFMLSDVKQKAMKGNSIGKEYTMPSGRVIRIRGYEGIVLDTLLSSIYEEKDLIVDDRSTTFSLPVFSYTTVERQNKRYFPDIYIPKKNKIIEVKSQWWYDGKGDIRYKGRLENNKRKRQAAIDAGYEYEMWLFKTKDTYEILS